jgi:nucleoside-diphosphate-sugar epimerase
MIRESEITAILPAMTMTDTCFIPHTHLLFGASGAVGRFVLRRLHDEGSAVTAITRSPPPAWSRSWASVQWLHGALEQLPSPQVERPLQVISAGPLDAFADWLRRVQLPAGTRLIALSSMSAQWKRHSPNAGERALAARLLGAEQAITAHAGEHALPLVLLRPTLIYGAGIDRSLSPLLRIARRWRCLPWPLHGRGLRQPVHADDLAAAMLAARAIDPPPAPLPLPGGDTLRYDHLLDRLLARLAPQARRIPLPLPGPLLRPLAALPSAAGGVAAVLWRSGQDQLAEPGGWSLLGLQPRGFVADETDFAPW